MKLKNYTSTVPAERSRSRIQQVLVELGATQISMEVANSIVCGMSFAVNIEGKVLRYRLPARVEAVATAMAPKRRPRKDSRAKDQAERTAWKLLQDWVEVQASLIKIGMSSATEVFMPYMIVGKGHGTTLWAHLSSRQGGLQALTEDAGKV